MNCIVVTDQNRGCYGVLLDQQFRQRRDLFVRQMAWDIPSTGTIEADQYDRPDTVYVLVEQDGKLVGYARLLQASSRARFGNTEFSYMVRDAVMGRLPGIPTDIFSFKVPPSGPDVWEMTRVQAENRTALTLLFETARTFLREKGALQTLTFTRKSFASILTSLNLPTKVAGPRHTYGGKEYCVLVTDLA